MEGEHSLAAPEKLEALWRLASSRLSFYFCLHTPSPGLSDCDVELGSRPQMALCHGDSEGTPQLAVTQQFSVRTRIQIY